MQQGGRRVGGERRWRGGREREGESIRPQRTASSPCLVSEQKGTGALEQRFKWAPDPSPWPAYWATLGQTFQARSNAIQMDTITPSPISLIHCASNQQITPASASPEPRVSNRRVEISCISMRTHAHAELQGYNCDRAIPFPRHSAFISSTFSCTKLRVCLRVCGFCGCRLFCTHSPHRPQGRRERPGSGRPAVRRASAGLPVCRSAGLTGQREPNRLFVALCHPLECHLALLSRGALELYWCAMMPFCSRVVNDRTS